MSTVPQRGKSTSMRGRSEGPVQAQCEILSNRRVGLYRQLTIVAPEIADRASPGQFVSIAVHGKGTMLRRPFSIAGVSRYGPWSGTLDVVFNVVGAGTEWLADRVKQDGLDVVGPLGRPFPLPRQQATCLLVGGGYGAAPLVYLAAALQDQGHRVHLLVGAATGELVYNAIEVKRVVSSARFTTEDGSFGLHGKVTDALPDFIDSAQPDALYACGSMGMLRAVAAHARRRKLPCQVAVEELMGCGTGVCMTCVIPYRRKDGIINIRACLEGPVLDAKRIVWDGIGADLNNMRMDPPSAPEGGAVA